MKPGLALWMTLCSFGSLVYGQAAPTSQLLYIHEDPVYPGMVDAYENVSKELLTQLKKHKIEDNYTVIQSEDFKYFTIVPIENMASLDRDPLEPLVEKMGKEAFQELFTAFNKCYPSHRDYLLVRSQSLSYMPEGVAFMPQEKPYRKYSYFYYAPHEQDAVRAVVEKIKKLYVEKSSKLYYNIYISRFGAGENYFLVEEAAKDAQEFVQLQSQNNTLLAAQWPALWAELTKKIIRVEEKTAHLRSDLSYTYSN
ncbi:hypothetical protein GCM10027275_42030 [Rhabdobacter roseus]